MKKSIIAAALILVSCLTAFSLTRNNNKAEEKIKSDNSTLAVKDSSKPKSDIATAD
jgi:hypothetical protein